MSRSRRFVRPAFNTVGAAVAGREFLPSDLPGLAGWYRYNSSITVVGAGVDTWADQSGNGRDLRQTTDTNRPLLDTDGSVLFDGVDNYLQTAAFTLDQPVTWFILFKNVTWTLNDGIVAGVSANARVVQGPTSTPRIGIAAGTGTTVSTNELAVGVYGAVAAVLNGDNSSLEVNMGAPNTNTTPGALNPGGITLGANNIAGAPANIAVKELIVLSTAPDAETRKRVLRYLMQVGQL